MMDDNITNIFDQLTERVIAFSPAFAKIAGGLAPGLLLAQMLYWHRAMDGKEFYKTDAEWVEETGLSRHEFRSAKAKLKALGFVSTKLKKSPAITHYKVDKVAIINAISSLPKSGKLDCGNPANKIAEIRQTSLPKSGKHIHTEITSEITPENTTTSGSNENSKSVPPNPKINSNFNSPPAPPLGGSPGSPSTSPLEGSPGAPPVGSPDPEDLARAEKKARQVEDCKAFLEYAVEKHESQRGITLLIDPEKDAARVIHMIRDLDFSLAVMCRCWDEFVRIESRFFTGKTRTIPLFVKAQVFQEMLERTHAIEQEGAKKIEEERKVPKVALNEDTEEIWRKVLEAMRPDILPENFEKWLAPTVGIEVTRDKIVVGVLNHFYTKCLSENYSQHIKTALSSVGISPCPKLEFIYEYEVVNV